MPDEQSGWKINSGDAPAAAPPGPAPTKIAGWTVNAGDHAAEPSTNANPQQPEAGGVAPGAPKPRLPFDLRNGPLDQLYDKGQDPLSQIVHGAERFASGAAPYSPKDDHKLKATPSPTAGRDLAGGASQVVRGSLEAAAPFALPAALVAAPVETGVMLGASALAQQGTESGLKAVGVPDEYANLGGDAVGLGTGAVVGKLGFGRYLGGKAADAVRAIGDWKVNSADDTPPAAAPSAAQTVRDRAAARSADVRGNAPAAAPPAAAPPAAAPEASGAPVVARSSPPAAAPEPPGEAPPIAAAPPPKLPAALAGAKPKYKDFDLNFESDLDKAGYIAAQPKPSKADAQYVAFVAQHSGYTEPDIRAGGAAIRETIKAMASDAEPGSTLTVPSHEGLWTRPAPPIAPPIAPIAPERQAGTPAAQNPNTAEVYTINGRKVNVRYDAREEGELTNSFQPGYPQEFQPRDTDRIASAQRVAQRKNDMNGALMADSRLASDGAPVILEDGTVITRNHGTQALRELYDANSPRAQDYKQWITDHAGEFGLDPAKIAGMDKPVLTRVLTDAMKPEDVAAFAQEANMSSAARMSDAEVAQSLSKRMTGPLMDTFDPAEDGTPNAAFVRELIKGLPVEEQGVFMDSKGQISQTGARIIRNTIFAKAYPDQRALERMAESENASLKNITGGMLRAAPKVAQFQESVARGDRFDLGIGPEIADAAAALDGIARTKSTLADWKAQGDMFGRDPVVSRLVDIFAENRRSGKRIGDVLREYTEVANDAGDPKQDSMFGPPETPNKAEILETAYERAKERWNPTSQSDLFGDEATPVAAGSDGLAAQEGPGAGSDEGALETRRQNPVAPDPNQQSLVTPEAEAASQADTRSAADKLLGSQLTAQMKSGMAARPANLKPAETRGMFDDEGPEQGALFSKRIGGPSWRKGMSRAELAAEAQAAPAEIGEEKHPALHVNAQAMDLIHQAAGRVPGRGRDSMGTTYTPERMAEVARNLHADADAARDAGHSANLRRLADAVTSHIDPARPSIVLQNGPDVTPAEYAGAAREELHHSIQLQATGPKFADHVDADKFLSSPEGQKATLALRKLYGQAGSPALAMEAGVRLMEPGRHGELGLAPEEAVSFARQYREHLIEKHGAARVAKIIEKVENAFKEFNDADKTHDETGEGDRQQQPQAKSENPSAEGAGSGGRGVSQDDGIPGAEKDDGQGELFAGTSGVDHLDARRPAGTRNPAPPNRVARDESREAVQKALSDQSDKDFGAKLRTYVTGERDVRVAETNQLRGDLQRMLPDPKDQEALTLMRDFKNRPGELAEFVSGSHKAFRGMDPEERAAAVADIQKLEPIIARAQNPTSALKDADWALTDYYAAHLKEGKELGFLDSHLSNDEYITHIGLGQALDVERPGLLQRLLDFGGKGSGPGVGPRGFKFAQKRDIPTVLHAVAYGVPPRTLNALDAMTIYGDQFARTAAAHLMMRELDAGGAAGWASFGGQRRGEVPQDWKEIAPDSPTFRKEVSWREQAGEPEETQNYAEKHYFAPEKVVDALGPIFSRNDMSRVPFFMTARVYQSYIKSVELALSVFHVKALNLTGVNNMGPEGALAAYQTDMQSPAFEAQERTMVRAGGTSPVLGRTLEAYHALTPKSLPSGPDVIRSLPVIRQVDRVAQAVSQFTFGVVQRKLKVTDFSLKDAAWLAKHPAATGAEHFEAQRNIARQVNATYGGLHWENLGVHRIALELSRALFLAPDWTYSNILNVGQSFEGGPAGSASRLFWLRSLVMGVALTEGMSLLLGGNAAKDPTNVEMGNDRNGGRVHQNLFFAGAPGDAVTTVHDVAKYGAVYGLAHLFFNKLGPLAKAGVDLNDARVKKGESALGKTWTGAKRLGEDLAPVPFAIPAIARMLRDPRGQYSMQDYVSTALTGQTPTHDAPASAGGSLRRGSLR